jgi:hypothetical protein
MRMTVQFTTLITRFKRSRLIEVTQLQAPKTNKLWVRSGGFDEDKPLHQPSQSQGLPHLPTRLFALSQQPPRPLWNRHCQRKTMQVCCLLISDPTDCFADSRQWKD